MQKFMLTILAAILALTWATPLDDYVNAPDSNYGYTYLTSIQGGNYGIYYVNMTSQKWLTESVTTTPVWWHIVAIIIPEKLDYTDTAFLWIGDHSSTFGIPDMKDEFIKSMTTLAVSTGTVCGVIYQIPFQPIVFQDDPDKKSRVEDAIIAWTWRKFLDNGTNPNILLRLPMTKAVVRGMDTLSTFSKSYTGQVVSKFVIGGESKRGWTTWTTAAVDKRVIGMVPTVMDLLNIQKNLHHHYRSLGGWTFAFEDYYTERVTIDLDNPNMRLMQAIIDPLAYSTRYTMPKMVVTSSGDEFFLPDDSYYYLDQLPGPKFLRIVPNAEHSMKGHTMSNTLAIQSFYLTILNNGTFPTMTWSRSSTGINGKIVLTTSIEPTKVTMYYARTLDGIRRDFRLFVKSPNSTNPMIHPVVWQSGPVQKVTTTQYVATVDRPMVGWTAFFIQAQFPGPRDSVLEFTTEVNIVPDTFPFPDCSGTTCVGSLV